MFSCDERIVASVPPSLTQLLSELFQSSESAWIQ